MRIISVNPSDPLESSNQTRTFFNDSRFTQSYEELVPSSLQSDTVSRMAELHLWNNLLQMAVQLGRWGNASPRALFTQFPDASSLNEHRMMLVHRELWSPGVDKLAASRARSDQRVYRNPSTRGRENATLRRIESGALRVLGWFLI